jgi:hypothetical protein
MERAIMRCEEQREIQVSAEQGGQPPTFEVDLSLPGVQELLRVVVEVERELRRKYPAKGSQRIG